MTFAAEIAQPLDLRGGAHARGLAQARLNPDMIGPVRHAIAHRLGETRDALARDDVRRFIDAQRAYTRAHYPEILAEIAGIAAGFGLPEDQVFDYLHCSSAMDVAALPEHDPDGCTAFALATPAHGALLAKNRDYRNEHVAIQRVMRHADPAWNGRELLVIGSLGSPGNFSSGINNAGLAIADTASRTTDMGPGFHRYFLLTWLLVHCATVDEALAEIRRITHTGSGLLVLADQTGAVASVELGHRAVGIERGIAGRTGRTNHFVTPSMAPANLKPADSAASRANSARRWTALQPLLAGLPGDAATDTVAAVLRHHDPSGDAAICRHGGADLSTTIAGAIYATRDRTLHAAFGQPCSAPWRRYGFAPDAPHDPSTIQPPESRP